MLMLLELLSRNLTLNSVLDQSISRPILIPRSMVKAGIRSPVGTVGTEDGSVNPGSKVWSFQMLEPRHHI